MSEQVGNDFLSATVAGSVGTITGVGGIDLPAAGQKILAASTLIRDVGAYLGSAGAVLPGALPALTPGAPSPVFPSPERSSLAQGVPEGGSEGGEAGRSLAQGTGDVVEAGVEAANIVGQAFGQAARNIRLDFDDLGGSVKNIFRDVGNSILQSLVSSVGSSLASVGGSAGGIYSSLFSSALPILGFAGGGRVQAGKPVAVGERGTEIIVPTRPATVMNAADSRGMLAVGPPTVNITNNFDLTPAPVVAAMIENAAPKIRDAAVSSTINTLRRGG